MRGCRINRACNNYDDMTSPFIYHNGRQQFWHTIYKRPFNLTIPPSSESTIHPLIRTVHLTSNHPEPFFEFCLLA